MKKRIKKDLLPPPQVGSNVFKMTEKERKAMGIENIPQNLARAIRAMKSDNIVRETLGNHAFEKYVAYKESEWKCYRSQITKWEIESYLYRY